MTMEERKIAYAAPNKPTPAQLAVLGARIATADRRLLDAPMIRPFQSPPADAVPLRGKALRIFNCVNVAASLCDITSARQRRDLCKTTPSCSASRS
jgi:hypothetical protein